MLSSKLVIDLLDFLGDGTEPVRSCDYLRLWELAYDEDGHPEFKAVRGAVYASVPAATMQRIRMGEETMDDIMLATACVIKQREWHRSILEGKLTWTQWTCWQLGPKNSPVWF